MTPRLARRSRRERCSYPRSNNISVFPAELNAKEELFSFVKSALRRQNPRTLAERVERLAIGPALVQASSTAAVRCDRRRSPVRGHSRVRLEALMPTTKTATTKKAAAKKPSMKPTTKTVTKKAATTKKPAAKKAATTKAATNVVQRRAVSAPPASVATTTAPRGPWTAIRDRRIGGGSAFGFYRHGCFVLAGSRALWGRPGKNRVGWLSLDNGAFDELFVCDTYANWVGTDGAVAIGTSKSQFVVLDPGKGKKPLRFPGAYDYCRQVVVTPTHVLTLQSHATKKQQLHVLNRDTFRLEKVSGDDSASTVANGSAAEISASGHAAFYLADKNCIHVWAPPYTKPTSLPLPDISGTDPMGRGGVRALGYPAMVVAWLC